MSPLCPECGEELPDYGECSCTTFHLSPRPKSDHKTIKGGMRSMVARKLAKQKAKVVQPGGE